MRKVTITCEEWTRDFYKAYVDNHDHAEFGRSVSEAVGLILRYLLVKGPVLVLEIKAIDTHLNKMLSCEEEEEELELP